MSPMNARHSWSSAVLVPALALVLGLGAAGCQRKTNIVVIPADSTGAAVIDSGTIALRDAQQLWESGTGEAAAAATARLLAREFAGREPGAWRERASFLLDSLGVGGEYADAPCALMVNYFSRSDPEAGSWPYLYWCGDRGAEVQAIEGANLHLQSIVARGLVRTGVGADSVRRVAAAFIRRAPGGPQPLVMTWALPPKSGTRWSLQQTLGADSLGGFGAAGFEAVSDTGADLATRTYRTPAGFVECATCPHAYTTSRFRWTAQGFVRSDLRLVASPYSTFTTFMLEAIKLDWHVKKGPWRPAPGSEESPLNMTFFRGQKDAFAVRFRAQGQGWVITGFEPVTRSSVE